ncbi:MAG: DNA adenine methylase [Defluviitaleaceae bacterium]|nr:DNA adenine methylase [Defluviitaleaceae bacterium]
MLTEMQPAKPFVKWVGGKGQLLNEIRKKYPADLGGRVKKYAEPFVGGGAVLFDILNNYQLDAVYIGDINKELIKTYQVIRDNVDSLIDILGEFQKEYNSSSEVKRREIYYNKRSLYNMQKSASDDERVRLAALFIFLNRTCFNGLYRVNTKGDFNVPQGRYSNPCICDEKNLLAVSEKLRDVQIVCGDYSLSANFIDGDTFVYFDPPYRPLSTTANFTTYSQNGFGDDEQIKLAEFINDMSNRGAYVLASNSDPKNADENDNFFDELYSRHKILRVEASRAINSDSTKRGKIKELLITNV